MKQILTVVEGTVRLNGIQLGVTYQDHQTAVHQAQYQQSNHYPHAELFIYPPKIKPPTSEQLKEQKRVTKELEKQRKQEAKEAKKIKKKKKL
jgi:hypothetical protein